MALKTVQVLAVLLTALCLVPSGAHLFELPNKIGLGRDAYFLVQGVYRGWSAFGFALIAAQVANGALAVLLRGRGASFWLALGGCLGIAATLAIFFAWTYPANVATENWTVVPENWEALRRNWEYAHAANAAITFAALCSVTLAVVCAPQE